MKEIQNLGNSRLKPVPRFAWILIVIADAGFMAWGCMAALAPEHLQGPGSLPIITAEYQNFTGGSWSELINASPKTADFITILFRMYGIFNVVFGFLTIAITVTAFRRGERWAWWTLLIGNTIAWGSAIIFDRVVKAIGIFEMTEYLGIAIIYVALAWTAPFLMQRSLVVKTN